MEKIEITAVVKYLRRKECLPRKFMKTSLKTLEKESPSYSTVTNGQQSLKWRERVLKMMDGLSVPKMPPLIKMSRSGKPLLCKIGGETCE